MNREFIGKKKFFLEDKPEISVIARLYVVESGQNEYMTAVLENGDAYQVEESDGPFEGLGAKTFLDPENRRFVEYPTTTVNGVVFLTAK